MIMTARLRAFIASQIEQQPAACAVALCVLIIVIAAIADAIVFGARTKYVHTVEALQDYYRSAGYPGPTAHPGAPGVPRIYLSDIPAGWTEGQSVASKKALFFRAVLPLVLKANEEVRKERRRLNRIATAYSATGALADADDRVWLRRLAERYEVAGADSPSVPEAQLIAPLLLRVDAIPPSIALAQAAVESAYGSSRFAVEGNALYGQWRTGGGLRPLAQPEHLAGFGIATFSSPLHSVAAYVHNLNTFPAYRAFRAARARHASGSAQSSLALADTLTAYSELGAEYVATLRRIIVDNNLHRLDQARLSDGRAVVVRLSPNARRQRAGL